VVKGVPGVAPGTTTARIAYVLMPSWSGRCVAFVIDQVVGNFRVLSLLGQGGMGEVYLAEHTGIQTRVAIKVLLPEISRDEQHVQRFFNEARIVGRIKHAGIVKIFDVGFHAGRAYLVMELLEGESLAARIQRSGRVAQPELVDIAHQIASILAASHAAGVVHRDLKPDNIYLVPDAELGSRRRVKVLDFGIAKLSDALARGPRTIGTMGTPAYMAPEQWGDAGSVDWRADTYSLGCVAFEMATGRPPFPANTIAEAFRNHTQATPPAVRSIVPELSPELEQLLACLLAKDPAQRAASSEAVARSFELLRELPVEPAGEWTDPTGTHAIAGGSRTPTPRHPTSPHARASTTLGASVGQLTAPPPRRRGWLAAAGAGAMLAVVATFAVTRGGASSDLAPASAPPPGIESKASSSPRPPDAATQREPTSRSNLDTNREPASKSAGATKPQHPHAAPKLASDAKPTTPVAAPAVKPEHAPSSGDVAHTVIGPKPARAGKPAPKPVGKPPVMPATPVPVVPARPAPAPAPRSELEDRT
jgi:serine/threonine-protein kinase